MITPAEAGAPGPVRDGRAGTVASIGTVHSMQLGVDFGTTRTIIATVDRGNYPVVAFHDPEGDSVDHIPSVVARDGDRLLYGFDAVARAADGGHLVRSFKRLLAAPDVTADTLVEVDGLGVRILDVMTGFLAHVRDALRTASNVSGIIGERERLDAVVAVPAHAHSAQRFLTLEAFRNAGFDVVALLNEPSAAGFEFTHRQGRTVNSRRTRVLVYDMGGGTFDASLVRVDDRSHEVLGSLGQNRLGGDDFDAVLAECARQKLGGRVTLHGHELDALLDECREAKENLSPQSKRVLLEVAGEPVVVPVADFYAAATPLVERSLATLEPLVGGLDAGTLEQAEVAGLYLVGGGSNLPLIARVLRERYGRRVHRSPYPAASTAIGLAIAADPDAGYSLTDRLSRGFGVFREADAGAFVNFDPLLSADQRVSASGRVEVTRRYRAAHNVGWFRFVEYTSTDASGQPTGEIAPFGEVVFPFDPQMRDGRVLEREQDVRREGGPLVEERYVIDEHGIVEVHLTDLDTGYTQAHRLSA